MLLVFGFFDMSIAAAQRGHYALFADVRVQRP
jgi:hypothetical protein